MWQALAREGSVPFEVWYLTRHGVEPSPDAEFKKSFKWDLNLLEGYPYEFLQTNPNPKVHRFWKVRLGEDLKKRFKEKKVKALWIQGWQVFAYWQAVWQAHEAGVEIWLRGESNDLAHVPFWKQWPKKFLLGEFFRRIDRFLYIGKANRRFYEQYGIPQEKLFPAPYAVDNDRFRRQAEALLSERTAIRREWKISEEAFCLLFAGKFIPKKRPFDLIRAVSNGRFQPSFRSIHLLFAGDGELGKKLREACNVVFDTERLTLPSPQRGEGWGEGDPRPPCASFVGFLNQTEISRAYVAADCLVLPSDNRETWGLVVNEAMASGLPCIVSDACGCSEDLIVSMKQSLCFSVGNIEELSKAIQVVMKESISREAVQKQIGIYGLTENVKVTRFLYASKAD